MTGLATTANEIPAFIAAGENTLFAIMTTPTIEPNGTAVVVMPGLVPTPGFGREAAYLCRHITTFGYHAVRFDNHGLGDSTGVTHTMHMENLFVQDLAAVLEWLRSQGLERFVMVGNCFGSRTALACATAVEGVSLLALAAPPVRDYELGMRRDIAEASRMTGWEFTRKALNPRNLRRVLNPRRRRRYAAMAKERLGQASGRIRPGADDHWVSQPFLRDLRNVIQRGIPTLFLYGEDDDFYREFQRARSGRLGQLLGSAPNLVDVRTLSGPMHDYRDAERQREMQDLVTDWILIRDGHPDRHRGAAGSDGSPA
jgi:pimeloyl-ACP methyl ester carboxylesterase